MRSGRSNRPSAEDGGGGSRGMEVPPLSFQAVSCAVSSSALIVIEVEPPTVYTRDEYDS